MSMDRFIIEQTKLTFSHEKPDGWANPGAGSFLWFMVGCCPVSWTGVSREWDDRF